MSAMVRAACNLAIAGAFGVLASGCAHPQIRIPMPSDSPIESTVVDSIRPGMTMAEVIQWAGKPVAEGHVVASDAAGSYTISSQPFAMHDWPNATWIYALDGRSRRAADGAANAADASAARRKREVPIFSTCHLFVEMKEGAVVRAYVGDAVSWSMN